MASLSEIVKGIQTTNDLLADNVKGQNRTAAMLTAFVTGQQSSFGDRLEAGREKGKSTRATARPVKGSGGGGFKSGFMKGSGLGGLMGFGSKIIGALFSGVAAAGLLTAISVAAGTAFGALVVTGAAFTLIKAFGEGIIATIFKSLDPKNVIFTKDQQDQIGTSITDALSVGVVGFMLGGVLGVGKAKLGAAFFLGSLLKDVFLSFLTPEKQADMKKQIIDKGTFESKFLEGISGWITPDLFLTMGATIASFFGLGAIRAGIMMAFTGGAGVVGAVAGKQATVGRNSKGQFTKLKPGLKKSFFKGFGMKLGLGLMLLSLGESLGNQIAALTGDEDLASFAQTGINATIIAGMLGGPYAALIVALGALTIIGFKKIQDWISKKNDKIAQDLEDKIAAAKALDALNSTETTRREVKRREYARAQELRRKQQLGGGIGGLTPEERLRLIALSGISLNRKNPLLSDVYKESARKFYTGETYDADMNPYDPGSADYIALKKAAKRAADRRREGVPGMNEIGAPPVKDFRPITAAVEVLKDLIKTSKEKKVTKAEAALIANGNANIALSQAIAQAQLANRKEIAAGGDNIVTTVIGVDGRIQSLDGSGGYLFDWKKRGIAPDMNGVAGLP